MVGSEEEDEEEQGSSEDEAVEEVELMPEDSYIDGKRQYATRRRVFLHRARARAGSSTTTQSRAGAKTKRSRVIRVNDSSDEEEEVTSKEQDPAEGCADAVPLWPKVVQQEPSRPQQSEKPSTSSLTAASTGSLLSKTQRHSKTGEKQHEWYKMLFILKWLHKESSWTITAFLFSSTCRCRQSLDNQHSLSDELDFVESESLLISKKQAHVGADAQMCLSPFELMICWNINVKGPFPKFA